MIPAIGYQQQPALMFLAHVVSLRHAAMPERDREPMMAAVSGAAFEDIADQQGFAARERATRWPDVLPRFGTSGPYPAVLTFSSSHPSSLASGRIRLLSVVSRTHAALRKTTGVRFPRSKKPRREIWVAMKDNVDESVIARMIDLRNQGYNYREIAWALAAQGLVFSPQEIETVLKSQSSGSARPGPAPDN